YPPHPEHWPRRDRCHLSRKDQKGRTRPLLARRGPSGLPAERSLPRWPHTQAVIDRRLVLLAAGAFVVASDGTLVVGLLRQIADSIAVSPATAGQARSEERRVGKERRASRPLENDTINSDLSYLLWSAVEPPP